MTPSSGGGLGLRQSLIPQEIEDLLLAHPAMPNLLVELGPGRKAGRVVRIVRGPAAGRARGPRSARLAW